MVVGNVATVDSTSIRRNPVCCDWRSFGLGQEVMTHYTRDQLLAQRGDKKTNHILHLILSVFSAGLWVPLWIMITIINAMHRGEIDRELGKCEK